VVLQNRVLLLLPLLLLLRLLLSPPLPLLLQLQQQRQQQIIHLFTLFLVYTLLVYAATLITACRDTRMIDDAAFLKNK